MKLGTMVKTAIPALSPWNRPEVARDRPRSLAHIRDKLSPRLPVLAHPLDRSRDRDRADADAAAISDGRRTRSLADDQLLDLCRPPTLPHLFQLRAQLIRIGDGRTGDARELGLAELGDDIPVVGEEDLAHRARVGGQHRADLESLRALGRPEHAVDKQ